MRKLGLIGSLFVALSLWAASSLPVFGDGPSGTVPVTISTSAVACIRIDTTGIAYQNVALGGTSVGMVQLDTCSTVAQRLEARGTDTTGGATWALVDTGTCSNGLLTNQFKHAIDQADTGFLFLSTSNKSLGTLPTTAVDLQLDTALHAACPGSNGAGSTLNSSIIFTAFLP
ncbi:MAG: hypothetical protein WD557_11495 [Dehalococcoidia bacterium]